MSQDFVVFRFESAQKSIEVSIWKEIMKHSEIQHVISVVFSS